jgi:hypothetical protein
MQLLFTSVELALNDRSEGKPTTAFLSRRNATMSRMIGKGLTTLMLVAALGAAASAQSRPDTRAMSCPQVQATIQNAGAIVLTTGQHTYDRYVASRAYCELPYTSRVATVQTQDGACQVLRCGDPLFEREGRFFRSH